MPGTDKHIATPISRFLALLGIMRLPARTEEGIQALVRLLAPRTRTTVTPHCPRTFFINNPLGFTAMTIFCSMAITCWATKRQRSAASY